MKRLLSAVVLSLFCVAAEAQVVSNGTITGSLNGENKTWHTIELPGDASTATWAEWSPGIYSISVQGHEGVAFSVERSLALTFSVDSRGRASGASAIFFPGESFSDVYEGDAGAITLKLDTFEADGEKRVISGSASGTLIRTKREGLEYVTDPGDTVTIDVTFETRALPE